MGLSSRAARASLRWGGRLAVLPFASCVVFVLAGGLPSWSGVAYVGAGSALLLGLATLPDAPSDAFASSGPVAGGRPRGLVRGAALVLALAVVAHVVSAGAGATMRFEARTPSALLAAVVDEQDLALTGARALFALRVRGLTDDPEAAPRALRDGYARLRDAHGDLPAPLVAQVASGHAEDAPPMVVLEPSRERPALGVVFLHGYGGSFVLPCATVARAFADVRPDVVVACPSLDVDGAWWSPAGGRALRHALGRVRERGARTIFLVGLSNGGVGLSRLVPRMRSELGDVAGVVLVSGVDPAAAAPGRPTLVVHGTRDAIAPYGPAAAWARRSEARVASLDAGHFAMLVREDDFRAAVGRFVRAHAGPPATARLESDETGGLPHGRDAF